jgi:hypothetical protein
MSLKPDFLKLYYDGRELSFDGISQELGVTVHIVNRLHKKFGLKPWAAGGPGEMGLSTIKLWEKIKPLLEKGINQSIIASELKITLATLKSTCRKNKWGESREKYNQRGIQARNEFKELYDLGYTDKQISERINKHECLIGKWRRKLDLPPNKSS